MCPKDAGGMANSPDQEQSNLGLNSVSSRCTYGKSTIARKLEVHPKKILMVKKLLKM